MTAVSSRKALYQRTWALFAFFFLPGLLMASWATRTPDIRQMLVLSTAEMGLVLFGISIGSMSGILCSGWLVNRFGARRVIRVSMTLVVIGMLLMSTALWFTSALGFAVGLAALGAGLGSAEVAVNVEGAIVERLMKKTLLPMMHGFYSLGTLAGAALGMALTRIALPAYWHLLLAAIAVIVPLWLALQAIPRGNSLPEQATNAAATNTKRPFWRDGQLLLIGFIVLAMAFAEGAANDWLPLLMVDGHGFSPSAGSLIYAAFTLGMTIGRFGGGWFIDRFSRAAIVRASALLGGIGIAIVIFIDNAPLAGAAVILWGVGASLGFPLTISAASDTGPNPAVRVSVVATTGYIAFLVGPPLLGFLGQHYGLRNAMIVVLILVAGAALAANAVTRRSPPA